jgi:hypothetical protein
MGSSYGAGSSNRHHHACPLQREAHDESGSSRSLDPHVTTLIQNSPAGERQPQSQSVYFAGCYEWFKDPISNLLRNSGSRVFYFDQHAVAIFSGSNANLSAARHCLKSVRNQVKKHTLYARAWKRQLDPSRHIEQDPNASIVRACGRCF